jgi:hypothetical protein
MDKLNPFVPLISTLTCIEGHLIPLQIASEDDFEKFIASFSAILY